MFQDRCLDWPNKNPSRVRPMRRFFLPSTSVFLLSSTRPLECRSRYTRQLPVRTDVFSSFSGFVRADDAKPLLSHKCRLARVPSFAPVYVWASCLTSPGTFCEVSACLVCFLWWACFVLVEDQSVCASEFLLPLPLFPPSPLYLACSSMSLPA